MRRVLTAALLRVWKRERWRHLQAMDREQWLDSQTLQRRGEQKLAEILRYAAANVPRYRELAAEKGWRVDAIDHERLGEFPLVDKTVLTAEQARHLAAGTRPEDRLATGTGGSTGAWFKFYSDWRSREYRQACDLLGRTWAGWRIGEPQALVWGHPRDLKAGRKPRARLNNALLHRTIILNAWQLNEESLRRFIERLQDHRPSLIQGYATALAFLAQAMRDQGITGRRPRGIINAGEYLSEDHREIIEAQFACKVLNRYGSREFGTIAQQCDHVGGLHVFTNRVHIEVLRPDGAPCAPGERGEIVVTDLTNRIMPFIRYRIGDLAVAALDPCPCGRPYPLLASVEGRTTEMIVGFGGKVHVCPTPTAWLKDMPAIRQIQIYQPDTENIEIRIVPGPQWGEAEARRLTEKVHAMLGPVRVTIVLREEIPVSASGKYRFAISEVSPFNRKA